MDLIPFELHRLFAGQTFLWGGDMNSAESMDDVPGFSGGNRRLREIWAEAGSQDLRLRFFADEQQTFFAPKRGAYQLDHALRADLDRLRVRPAGVIATASCCAFMREALVVGASELTSSAPHKRGAQRYCALHGKRHFSR